MIDKGLYKTRKNFRIGSKSGKDTSGRRYDRPSAPAPSTPRSSPFSGNESRQQYSAKQTQTGAVKGGGRRVGPPGSDKYETGFVSGDDGRAARDDFIRGVQETNPDYTGGIQTRKLPTLGQFIGGALNLLPGMGIARGIGERLKALTNRFRQPTPDMSQFNTLGLLTDRVTPNYYNDLDNQGLLSLIGEEEPSTLKSIEAIDNLKKIPGLQELYERDKNASLLNNLNTFRDPPSKEITDYQNFLTKSPDFVSFDEYQRNKALASKGIMQSSSLSDLTPEQKQQRVEIANQFDLPYNYSASDLDARARRAMTQPGIMATLEPTGIGTVTAYDPYKEMYSNLPSDNLRTEVKPNTLKQLKNMGIYKEGEQSPYTDKDELRMLVPALNNASDQELDQIIQGTFTT